jgi:hypothetical protein
MHYNNAGDWLKPIDCIQDNALIISVVVLSELATCSIRISNFKLHVVSTYIPPKSHLSARHSFGTIGASSIRISAKQFFYVEPDKEADASPSPVFSALAGSPFWSGLVADALKLCSKSAMMSSMCSVPTEMRMRSY